MEEDNKTTETVTPDSPATMPYTGSILKRGLTAAFIDNLMAVLLLYFIPIISSAITGFSFPSYFEPIQYFCMAATAWIAYMPVTLLSTWIYRKLRISARFELLSVTLVGLLSTCIVPFLFSLFL